nr:glycosyltransferase [Cytophagales bacterium]
MKAHRILFLSKYPPQAASSRLRTYQFLPFWRKEVAEVEIAPLLNERYLRDLYAGKPVHLLNVLRCYIKRFFLLLFHVRRFDLIWVEKEFFPYFPPVAEWFISRSKGFVVDFDDAIFHNYDLSPSLFLRKILPKKIDAVMHYADLVFAGNPYLIDRAKKADAKRTCFLPTVIDPSRYRQKEYTPSSPVVCIGWIGSPSTQKYLKDLLPVFENLHQRFAIRILLVNGREAFPFSGKIDSIPWTEEGEVDAILCMDIGIMPLPDNPWERGKCAYKLIQYMACGLPVVASPVGFNTTVVRHGVNGYLADTSEDWQKYLTDLILHPERRQAMGKEGFCLVQESYTLEKNIERIRQGLDGILSKKSYSNSLSPPHSPL